MLLKHLFFLLFTSTVLSPYVRGIAVYLYFFVPFLDLDFVRTFGTIRRQRLIFTLAFFVILATSLEWLLLAKGAMGLVTLLYLVHAYERKQFYLYKYAAVNVLVAVAQFFGQGWFGYDLLDPSLIAESLYGSFAMPTGETFAEGLLFNLRVSGLNKEPGFFASLLCATMVVGMEDPQLSKSRKIWLGVVLGAGILLSFSKISLMVLSIYPIIRLSRRYVDYVPLAITIGIFVGAMIYSVLVVYEKTNLHFTASSEFHRTIGYYVMTKLDPISYLFGLGTGTIVKLEYEMPFIANSPFLDRPAIVLDNSGIARVIVELGIVHTILMLLLLSRIGVKSSRLLTFLLLTVNVNPYTSSSFVLLGWFYLTYGRRLSASTPESKQERIFLGVPERQY